jgi:hypothetical protein
MPRITHVQAAQQRYEMVPVTDTDGNQVRTETSRTTKKGRAVTRRQSVPDKSKPLPPYTCDYCHEGIAVGESYKHISPRSGPYGGRTLRRHEGHPNWHPWEYSDSLSAQLAQIEHDFSQAVSDAGSGNDVQSALDEAAAAIREIAEAKREAAQNIEDGFQHPTSQSEDLTDIADQLDDWAGEVESAEIPDFPEAEEADCEDCDGTGQDENEEDCETCVGTGTVTPDEPTEDQVDEWRSEVESSLSIVGEPPV